ESEYLLRVEDMKKLAKAENIQNIDDVPYDIDTWHGLCDAMANEPEGGKRCEICFKMRLEKTAQKAKELSIEIFATTLTVSPHKNAALINKLGKEAGLKYGVNYYESDFKKKDGFK